MEANMESLDFDDDNILKDSLVEGRKRRSKVE